GFDADASSCEKMNAELEKQKISWTEKHIPLGLWNSTGTATLYVTKFPGCSSLYPPSQSYIERFVGNSAMIELQSTEEIKTTTLDDFCRSEGIEEIDFLQIDTQGGELKVLEGAAEMLEKSVMALIVEVEFTSIYENQPLFSDVDLYLRKKGFTLFDLAHQHRDYRRRGPVVSPKHPGQLIWADAFYFRDLIHKPDKTASMHTPDRLLKLACMADILNFPDYATELLEYITREYGKNPKYNFANQIIEVLAQFPELVKQGLDSLPAIEKIRGYADSSYNLSSSQNSAEDLSLNLRDINLIIFPDWSQPEDSLGASLSAVIEAIATHPEKSHMTLLIDTDGIEAEDANLFISGVAMNLLLQSDLDVTDGAEISLIGKLSAVQWDILRPRLQARIVLEQENEPAIALAGAENLRLFPLDLP
ncbi:MAG: FkbM family methyltransferase, partial [Hormoscilla sp.]